MTANANAPQQLSEMISTLAKTFAIAHDKDSDAHLAQALVYNAGRLAWRMRESGVNVESKTSISDVVTDADRAAEQFVVQVLEHLRPEDGIVGEEGTDVRPQAKRRWIIDPVDGTYNFTRGSDYWCAALALEDSEGKRLGAVHRPAMGYTWFGGTDTPTTRDAQALATLENKPLSECAVGTYLHPKWMQEPAVQRAWQSVIEQAATVRMLGAGSVDLAGVAEGSLDLWMQHSVPEWDWLPGRALVEGVQGKCVQVTAGGVQWSIAGNPQAVDEAVALLESAGSDSAGPESR